jgi:hypothetical protein
MQVGDLPPQLRPIMQALTAVVRSREPAIRERVKQLRAEHPDLGPEGLSRLLIRGTRSRVAATGALSGASAIAPGIGTLVALGAATGQGLYALEQETELVLAIAMLHSRELADSDERLFEALVVVGLAGGAVKLRENVLVAGGQRITVAAFRRLPGAWLGRAGTHALTRVLGRALAERAAAAAVRTVPLAVGMAAGAGFDWVAVTLLGRAALRYYRSAGDLSRSEDRADVEAHS